MELTDVAKAKKLFLSYRGSHFHMAREGDYEDYKNFGISKDVEYEWLRELQAESLDMLNRASNNKLKAEAFDDYAEMVSRLKDPDGVQFMLEYIKAKAVFFDSNTLERCSSSILDIIGRLEDVSLQSRVAREVLALLKRELNQPITVSDHYRENGKFPDGVSIESVTTDIKDTIQYWENEYK